MNCYKTSTCFGTEVPSTGGRSIQRNVDPTHRSSYYVAFTEVIKILNVIIIKYVKLMTINLQCCNINSTKSVNNKPFQVLQLFATVRSHIQTSVSIVCRDLVHGGESVRKYREFKYIIKLPKVYCVTGRAV
jgi:hypothetical protein